MLLKIKFYLYKLIFLESYDSFKEELGKTLERKKSSNNSLTLSENDICEKKNPVLNSTKVFEDFEKRPILDTALSNKNTLSINNKKHLKVKNRKSKQDNRSLTTIKRKNSSISLLTDKSRIESLFRKYSSSQEGFKLKQHKKHDKSLLHKLIILNE